MIAARMGRTATLAATLSMLMAANPAQAAECGLKLIASYAMDTKAAGMAIIPVNIAGAPRATMIDTGSFANWVTEHFVDAAKFDRQSIRQDALVYGAEERVMNYVLVPSVDIGPIHQGPSKFMVQPDTAQSTVDAAFGNTALEQFDIEFDFGAGKVNFFSQDHCAGQVVYWAKSYTAVPFKMVDDQIFLTMTLDGHDLDTLLDTGTTFSYLNTRVALNVFGYDEHSPNVKQVTLSKDYKPYVATFGSLSIGGISFPKPSLLLHSDTMRTMARLDVPVKDQNQMGVTLPHFPHLLLGMDALHQLHLYIAFKEHKIYVTAAGAH